MMKNVILKIISLLVETLEDIIPDINQHIQAEPLESPGSSNLPMIALNSGHFTIDHPPGASTSSEPRPAEFDQKLPVSQASPSGPYTLTRTPLSGSVRCQAFIQEGTLSERQLWLQEKQDFTVNYTTKTCLFTYDLSKVDSLLFLYSFVSIFSIYDFKQDLFIDLYAADASTLEKLASLIAGLIMTQHNQLIEACNQDPAYKTEYSAGGISTTHQLSQIQFLAGQPEYTSPMHLKLKFVVSGQIKATREVTEGFGLIEKIHSPDRPATQGIDIAIAVE